jgi:NAD(P)-dependent dehydrogenase (short-subunit alcohol dehydrogenase family)
MAPGSIAVVTGGASGIGKACSRVLAEQGYLVVILDRDLPAARTAAEEVAGRAYAADVGNDDELDAAAARIEAEVGAVEVLVNSAGIIQQPVRPSELSMRLWDDVVRIDQRGTYLGCLVFGKHMLGRRRGSIVNIASIAGMRSMPLHAYSPAKAAVISMTACLAAEWGPSGIRVNAVSPGYTLTPALQHEIDAGRRDVEVLAGNAALGRLVEPEEIGRVVAFLASSAASAITGINIPVDCGCLAASSWHAYGGLRQNEAALPSATGPTGR